MDIVQETYNMDHPLAFIIIIMITPLGPWAVRSIYLHFFFTGFGVACIPEAQGSGTSR